MKNSIRKVYRAFFPFIFCLLGAVGMVEAEERGYRVTCGVFQYGFAQISPFGVAIAEMCSTVEFIERTNHE